MMIYVFMTYYDVVTLITEHAHAIQTNLNIYVTFWEFSYFILLRISKEEKWNVKHMCLPSNPRFVVFGYPSWGVSGDCRPKYGLETVVQTLRSKKQVKK